MSKIINRVWRGALVAAALSFVPAYAASDAFQPAQTLTPDQLRAVIDAPRFSAEANRNKALNPNDPASYMRPRKK